MNHNPFVYGDPVSHAAFVGRRKELRRIVGRILNQGQSSALVGEPRLGKTSLLNYLRAPEQRTTLYSDNAEQLIFSFCDSQTFATDFSTADFWRQVLSPVKQHLIDPAKGSPLAKLYQTAQLQRFDSFRLEAFFQQLNLLGYRLVLLIDEFDALLHHPMLNRAEFFGSLRSLASNSAGALSLVIASRTQLSQLNAATQKINPTGSPFFNIFAEVTLGGLSDSDIERILVAGKERFSAADQRYICQLSGGQPYLLQAAASLLWEAYDEELSNEIERQRYVLKHLHADHEQHFANTWRVWRPEVRQAFTTVALLNAKAQIFRDRQLETNTLLECLANLRPECNDLEATGLLVQNPVAIGGWNVAQGIMNVWLIDEIIRSTRNEDEFGQWLNRFEIEGLWTKGQREQIQQYAKTALPYTKDILELALKAYGTLTGKSQP